MRVKQLVAASVASGILAFGVVPDASAAPALAIGSVVVQPRTVAPGGQVSVFANDCTANTGTATSVVFTASIHLSMMPHSFGGVGTVSLKANPGTWKVYVTCGEKRFTGLISVCKCGGKPSPSPSASPSTAPSGGVPSSGTSSRPKGGAATGDGASQASAASGVSGWGSGVVLTAAGVGLGALALRRLRSGAQR